MTNVIDLHSERMKQGEFNKANHNSTKGKMTMQMSKRNVTNLFKALDFAITNAEDLNLDRQELEEIKKKNRGGYGQSLSGGIPRRFCPTSGWEVELGQARQGMGIRPPG
jgi:hypothetical protein